MLPGMSIRWFRSVSLSDEVDVVVDVDVDSGHILEGAVDAPGHESYDMPEPGLGLADQRSSSVPFASVLTLLTASAAKMQQKGISNVSDI